MNILERLIHPALSSAERYQQITELIGQYPLTNQLIWYHIVAARGYLNPGERSGIVEAYKIYKKCFPQDDTPVSEILKAAQLPDIGRDRFFRGVCFNYDIGLGAVARREDAMAELAQGKRDRVDDESEFWTVEKWVAYDFFNMSQGNEITGGHRFGPSSAEQERLVMSATGDSLNIPDPFRVREIYTSRILPLLGSGEVIKPGQPYFYYGSGLRAPNGSSMATETF